MADDILPMTLDIVRASSRINLPVEDDPNYRIVGFKVHVSKLGEYGLSEPLAPLMEITQIVEAYDAHRACVEALRWILSDKQLRHPKTNRDHAIIACCENALAFLDRQSGARPESEAVRDVSGLQKVALLEQAQREPGNG
jgi:hypothetical protein